MTQFHVRWIAAAILISSLFALAPAGAQTSNTVTRIDSSPSGASFYVDGTFYSGATTATWPVFSKHTLSVPPGPQNLGQLNLLATFTGWTWAGGGASSANPLVITADPNITEYTAVYSVSYGLTASCASVAGTVFANGNAMACGQASFFGAGTTVTVTAAPADGYVFAGWASGPNQSIQATVDVVTLNGPTQVTPMFQPARQMNIATVPAGLRVLVDQATVFTPYQAVWGYDSVHSVGPVSPQQDTTVGAWWVFSSWSDNGAANHAYTVGESSLPASLTATFVPGVPMGFYTSPAGLSLTVDGRSNWLSYSFIWGVGETHTVSAPDRQTDAQGRLWAFSGWSNGGPAAQSVTVPANTPGGVRFVATYTPLAQLTVTSSVSGLNVMVDGSACATPCNVVRSPGAQVDVNAPLSLPAGAGSRLDFLGWSTGASNGTGPNDLILTLGADPVTVGVNYHLMNYLAASSNPSGGVNWSMQPVSADGYYDSQTTVNVSVTPLAGYKFRSWSGDLSGPSPAGALAMIAPRTIQAILDKVPYVPPSAVTNAAGGAAGSGVAPGSVISIYGLNLASGTVLGPSGSLAQTLGGLTVRIGDRLLPLFFVSPSQINAQLPADFAPGSQTVILSAPGQPDAQTGFTIVQDAPGLFQQTVNGQALAIAFHADGSAVTTGAPAQSGETITIYGTGFGPTTPARPEGLPVANTPPLVLTDPAAVQLGGAIFAAANAFAVPGAVGIDAIQFVLGSGAANGQLSVTVNGQQSNAVLLPMQ